VIQSRRRGKRLAPITWINVEDDKAVADACNIGVAALDGTPMDYSTGGTAACEDRISHRPRACGSMEPVLPTRTPTPNCTVPVVRFVWMSGAVDARAGDTDPDRTSCHGH